MKISIHPGLRLLAGILCGAVALSSGSARAEPVTSDLWDVSGGTVVTAHSGTTIISSPRNLLGGTGPGVVEASNTLFKDSQLAGFVHFVEWQTPSPILLESFNLFAIHDGQPFDANERGFRRFALYARDPTSLEFEQLFEFFPTNPYTQLGPGFLLVSAALTPTIAQDFRAEFEQFGDRTSTARGPRVVELDGFGTVVPEPGATILLVLGALGLVGFRRLQVFGNSR